MQVSTRGLAFIARWESFRPLPYHDQAGYQTIGYGHRIRTGEHFALPLTQEQSLELFHQDAAQAEACLNAAVETPLTQTQFDALVSLVYNIGTGAFEASTLLADINAGDMVKASAEFDRWNKIRQDGTVVSSPGLSARRAAEKLMFLEG